MESATAIIDAAQQRRVRPSPAFFTKQIEAISHFPPATPTQLSGQVNEFRFSLATYRSLFNPKPVIPRKVEEWKPGEEVKPFVTFHISGPEAQWVLPPKVQVLAGPEKSVTFDAYNLGDKDLFVPSSRSMEDSQNVVDYVTVLGGSQTLDGIDWKNVTFVNVHIKYTGGSMRLRNVKFVNCTFDLPNDKYGAQIADYVALDSKDLWM
jgi:hypothetical protein